MDNQLSITVIYATPDRQWIESLQIPAGTTVRQALQLSRLPQQVSDLKVETQPIGVFGQVVDHDYVLQNGDRLEVYRPLLADPKEARRLRAKGKR